MNRKTFEWIATLAGYAQTTATRDLIHEGWTDGLNWAWVREDGGLVVISAYGENDIGRLVEALDEWSARRVAA
jgi:hypothetical protein